MNKKLTLLVGDTAISKGKRYASKNATSLSGMVEDYLLLLDDDDSLVDSVQVSRKLQSLVGIGKGEGDKETYRKHLEQKYS